MKSILVPTIALTMAFSGAAFAQSSSGSRQPAPVPLPAPGATFAQSSSGSSTTSQPGSTATKPSPDQHSNMTAINKLKTDLQNAGFTDVQVVADSYVVQAKDKNGNPVIMTLSPGGVVAYETITMGGNHTGTTGSGSKAKSN